MMDSQSFGGYLIQVHLQLSWATSSVNAYGAWVADMKHEQFRAANGSKVDIDGTATITVWVGFHTGRDKDWVPDYKICQVEMFGRWNQSQHHVYDDIV